MNEIEKVQAREILDSRGNPTIEVDITLKDGSFGRASVPSGASTGAHEALELRDGGERYNGKGELKAVANIEGEISGALVGKEFDQTSLDQTLIKLDGTENKSRLGANAILGVSLAFAKAVSESQKIPLFKYFSNIGQTGLPISIPRPMMNVLNGGKHATNSCDFQEFMIVPLSGNTFAEKLEKSVLVFESLKEILELDGQPTTVGDEGGFAPHLPTNQTALELLMQAIATAGFKPGEDFGIAIDVASSEFYKDGVYTLNSENKKLSSDQLIELYQTWLNEYPIISIEDGLSEDDWEGWQKLTETLGDKLQLVGDDLFVTNSARVKMGVEKKCANAVLIKLNQIGTLTETIECVKTALAANYKAIISHRSGETEDTTIADLAAGLGVGQIKTGSLSRTDRMAKYNQLLRIEEML